MIGPVMAVVPAVLVALPLGGHTVVSVIGLAVCLQLVESNVLIPRIMHRAVGVSALAGLLAILAFGTLYGILGIFIAIPMTAVIQVLLNTMVVTAEPAVQPTGLVGSPWDALRARVGALREQARGRLRMRRSRMGIDPATTDHVVDAVDQQIEVAVARVEKLITAAEETSEPLEAQAAAIVTRLQRAMEEIEQAVDRVDMIKAPAQDMSYTSGAALELALAEPRQATGQREQALEQVATAIGPARTQDPVQGAEPESLGQATQRFSEVVQDVETLVIAAEKGRR